VTVSCRNCGDGVRVGTYRGCGECDIVSGAEGMGWALLEKGQSLQDNIRTVFSCLLLYKLQSQRH
jgi:hypothetical protein